MPTYKLLRAGDSDVPRFADVRSWHKADISGFGLLLRKLTLN